MVVKMALKLIRGGLGLFIFNLFNFVVFDVSGNSLYYVTVELKST